MIQIGKDFSSSSLSTSKSRDLSSRNLSSSTVSLKAFEDLSNAPKHQQQYLDYDDNAGRKPPALKPEGDLVIRSPGAAPFKVPFNSWESLAVIKTRIAEHLEYDLEPYHYVTDHGSIQQTELLKDYQLQNNSIVLMIPKNQFEKERIRRREVWLRKMPKTQKSSPKIVVPKPVKNRNAKPPFHVL